MQVRAGIHAPAGQGNHDFDTGVSYSDRMRTVVAPALFFVALLTCRDALACIVNLPPESHIQRNFDAVVIATVTSSGYVGKKGSDIHPWRASARLKKVIQGVPNADTFEIGRSGSTAACDDGQDPPEIGDDWVIYLAWHQGRLAEFESYPLSWALVADPRFHPQAKPTGRKSGAWACTALLLALLTACVGAAAFWNLLRRKHQPRTGP